MRFVTGDPRIRTAFAAGGPGCSGIVRINSNCSWVGACAGGLRQAADLLNEGIADCFLSLTGAPRRVGTKQTESHGSSRETVAFLYAVVV
jgi:hypothetical protein